MEGRLCSPCSRPKEEEEKAFDGESDFPTGPGLVLSRRAKSIDRLQICCLESSRAHVCRCVSTLCTHSEDYLKAPTYASVHGHVS